MSDAKNDDTKKAINEKQDATAQAARASEKPQGGHQVKAEDTDHSAEMTKADNTLVRAQALHQMALDDARNGRPVHDAITGRLSSEQAANINGRFLVPERYAGKDLSGIHIESVDGIRPEGTLGAEANGVFDLSALDAAIVTALPAKYSTATRRYVLHIFSKVDGTESRTQIDSQNTLLHTGTGDDILQSGVVTQVINDLNNNGTAKDLKTLPGSAGIIH